MVARAILAQASYSACAPRSNKSRSVSAATSPSLSGNERPCTDATDVGARVASRGMETLSQSRLRLCAVVNYRWDRTLSLASARVKSALQKNDGLKDKASNASAM